MRIHKRTTMHACYAADAELAFWCHDKHIYTSDCLYCMQPDIFLLFFLNPINYTPHNHNKKCNTMIQHKYSKYYYDTYLWNK